MPDASDVRAFRRADFRDFADTQATPPQPDCEPFAPFNDAPALPVPEVRVIESDGPAPYLPTRAERLLRYPSAEQLVRERDGRERRHARREPDAFGEAKRHADALTARFAAGFDEGHLAGYNEGWYWGLAFGAMCGVGLTYLAMRLGMWIGA